MEQQLVVFELANELYGVNIAAVESIIKMQAITQLPHTPSYVKGVTNLRGSVLPVIDLRVRFGLEAREDSKQTRVMIVTMGSVKAGIIVDAVSEVLRISEEAIEPLPAMLSSVDAAFLKGIARLENRLIILLELGRVLSFDDQKSLEALTH